MQKTSLYTGEDSHYATKPNEVDRAAPRSCGYFKVTEAHVILLLLH